MPDQKSKILYALKSLIELVENDQIRLDQIQGLTTSEIIDLAEAEAAKAKQGAQELKDTPDA